MSVAVRFRSHDYLPSSPSTSGPQNVVQLSVHLASMLLDITVGFLERVLEGKPSSEVFSLLGSSFLFSTLLPATLAQLGPIACRQPKVASREYRLAHLLYSINFNGENFPNVNLSPSTKAS